MYDITGVISLLNILLSELYCSFSSSVVISLLVWILLAVCLSREEQEEDIYTHRTLVRVQACDRKAVLPSYDNKITDSRNRFLESASSWKTGFLRISNIGPLRIATLVWQNSSGHSSNYMRQ